MSILLTYRLAEGFNVDEVRELIKLDIGRQTALFQYKGIQYYAIGLVACHPDLFGIDFLIEMLQQGYKVNPDGATTSTLQLIVTRAPTESTAQVIRLLLEFGSNVEEIQHFGCCFLKRSPSVEAVNLLVQAGLKWNPRTVLNSISSPDLIRYFLEMGAVITFENFRNASREKMELLISSGFDLTAQDEKGDTILHWGFKKRVTDNFCRELISLGADPSIKNAEGMSFKAYFVNAHGKNEWYRAFGIPPFMNTVDGIQWRFSPIGSPDRKGKLLAERLTQDGIESREVGYFIADEDILVSLGDDILAVPLSSLP